MSRNNDTRARAVADLREGLILASVKVAANPERVLLRLRHSLVARAGRVAMRRSGLCRQRRIGSRRLPSTAVGRVPNGDSTRSSC